MIEIDINDRTRTPCQTEGCKHPNYHVCLVGKINLVPKILEQENKREAQRRSWQYGNRRAAGPRSDETRERISEANRQRHARAREQNKERDAKILERYNQGDVSINDLAAEFKISRNVTRTLIREGRRAGIVTFIRRVGHNVKPSNNAKAYQEKIRAQNKERDDQIVERYNRGDIGSKALALQFGMSKTAVLYILKREEKVGRVHIRPGGRTLMAKAG